MKKLPHDFPYILGGVGLLTMLTFFSMWIVSYYKYPDRTFEEPTACTPK